MNHLRPVSTTAAAVLALLAGLSAAHADDVRRPYLIELADQPVAAYSGGLSGLRATHAASGQRIDLGTDAVQQYSGYLTRQQNAVKSLVAAAPVSHQYQLVFNGFAARLTDAEVHALKASGQVARISPDEARHVLTNYTPTFLGLDAPGGLWDQLGGKQHAGEDVIIGVIDTGIWPENLSYADRVDAGGRPTFAATGALAYGAPPARWKGQCQTGEGFTAANCNNKLIGARYFDDGFRANGNPIHASEFRSPRDSLGAPNGDGGHGTHTSSTAAGNNGVDAVVGGNLLAQRSGIAPRARLAMYKICWTYNAGPFESTTGMANTCYNSDSMAAIEQAIKDGVDVLSYSISGGASVLDPVEQAFRHAAEAGVFIAAAGGNAGPDQAVSHISPWLTTVAASTHDRAHLATVTLGNGFQVSGTSLDIAALPATAIIRAEDAALPGANASDAAQCWRAADEVNELPTLDPAKVAGKIVACRRGGAGRVNKAVAVRTAGGVGMILIDDGSGQVLDVYPIPTVHVDMDPGNQIADYASGAGATAAISASVLTPVVGPVMADFSSRGPNAFDAGVLKPDMTAPGVDILAGVAPSLDQAGHDAIIAGNGAAVSVSTYMSGTSMATPHVAGLGALLRQRHPDWSPAAIKSALMTSTTSVHANSLTGDQDGTLPWGQGAGHVTPNSAADPGLVYDAGAADYKKYMCGITAQASDCDGGTQPGYALNLASITLPGVVGIQSVSRSVTNVGASTAIYNGTVEIDGYTATLTPATLTLDPGQTQSYTVNLRRTTADDGLWKFGTVVWTDGEHKVRSPLQARYNSGAVAPALVSASGASGVRLIGVATGFDGKMTATHAGMREVTRVAQTVTQAPAGSLSDIYAVSAACAARGPGVKEVALGIPSNTMVARFELFNHDTDGGADDDLDLAVFDQGDGLLGYSGNEGSNETVTLTSPPTGIVKVCVMGFKVKNGKSANYTLSYAMAIPNDTKGNVKLGLPGQVKLGGTASVALNWSGLDAGKRFLGGMQLLNPAGRVVSTTEFDIDTGDTVPALSPSVRAKRDSKL
ncbi:S8 family serine peptidase [Rugamonas sp.]|uniref:S8 family serine peptidase n=1 Tax=Rugamonas sp. TaxID=1926287 RepID=UPI0025E35887|nr:S8 family serine peptidase [Rugamonas sp.]